MDNLSILIYNKKWDEVLLNCINERDKIEEGKNVAILQLALYKGAPDKIILAILKANPIAASVFNTEGDLPIHTAFRFGRNKETIKVLYDAYPDAAVICDSYGRTPLRKFYLFIVLIFFL